MATYTKVEKEISDYVKVRPTGEEMTWDKLGDATWADLGDVTWKDFLSGLIAIYTKVSKSLSNYKKVDK